MAEPEPLDGLEVGGLTEEDDRGALAESRGRSRGRWHLAPGAARVGRARAGHRSLTGPSTPTERGHALLDDRGCTGPAPIDGRLGRCSNPAGSSIGVVSAAGIARAASTRRKPGTSSGISSPGLKRVGDRADEALEASLDARALDLRLRSDRLGETCRGEKRAVAADAARSAIVQPVVVAPGTAWSSGLLIRKSLIRTPPRRRLPGQPLRGGQPACRTRAGSRTRRTGPEAPDPSARMHICHGRDVLNRSRVEQRRQCETGKRGRQRLPVVGEGSGHGGENALGTREVGKADVIGQRHIYELGHPGASPSRWGCGPVRRDRFEDSQNCTVHQHPSTDPIVGGGRAAPGFAASRYDTRMAAPALSVGSRKPSRAC